MISIIVCGVVYRWTGYIIAEVAHYFNANHL